ncbi:MAG TPA: SDR family NAD(P)-dependent oxidoreductase [Saprospiraceae bacterium]|nr:SDR family NAD(P)-dependent oxidoreductase [Saprospiraceae bacterium]
MKLSNNTILITGGASGIGLGLAERFVQENNTVIICGRREDALKAVTDRHPSVISRVCDLTVESERVELYDWVQENHSDLNVLVNNAGIQNWMQWNEADFYARAKSEIEINVIAPIHLTTLFLNLNSLKTIMNVTSGLAFVQLAKAPVYCATKAFFHSLTLSQRYLLRDREIEVIEIIPPALNTDLGGKGLHDDQPPVSAFIDSIFEQIKLGKDELTYGFSELMTTASPEMIKATFDRMNPPR